MRSRRGKSQLLPTPQTSTTSTKEDNNFLLSSEVDEHEQDGQVIICIDSIPKRNLRLRSINKNNNNNNKSKSYSTSYSNKSYITTAFNLKKPRLLRSKSKISRSSWPFRSAGYFDKFLNFSFSFDPIPKKEMIILKRLIQRDFPYYRVIDELSDNSYNLLFEKELWTFLLNISTIYTGEDVQGDRQKRNEVAFAAWTTLLRVYGKSRVRGGREQLQKLAVASIVLQSKLLEESDVDLKKLEKKLTKYTKVSCEKQKIEVCERKICSLLEWKLLVPSPQVILFSVLDALNLPMSLKLLVSKVLDQLIEDNLLQEYLKDSSGLLANLVISVIEIVLCDFFSVFQSDQINVKKVLKENLPVGSADLPSEQREKIEKAIETVMCEKV